MATPLTPGKKINRLGLEQASYRGGKTTLCAGCGHNAISERLIEAFFEMGVDAKRITLINPPIDSVLANGHVSPVTAYLFFNSAPLGILYVGSGIAVRLGGIMKRVFRRPEAA